MFSVVLDPGEDVNAPPEASFTADCDELTCQFDAGDSSDPEGADLTYTWNFGDAATGTGETTEHTYASSGPRTVTLTVNDGNSTDQTTRVVDPQDAVSPGEISFVGSATTAGNRPSHSVTIPQSVQPGDRLLLFLTTNSTTSTISDSLDGWTLLQSRDGNGVRGRVWTRAATAIDAGRVVNITGSALREVGAERRRVPQHRTGAGVGVRHPRGRLLGLQPHHADVPRRNTPTPGWSTTGARSPPPR